VCGPALRADRPWGHLIEEFCEVILAPRPRADVELLGHACDVAARCHQGQTRLSGHPYITHPVAVATILAGLEEAGQVDDQVLCAAVLHDTVQDTPYTLAALKRDFGAAVATMVTEHAALDRLGGHQGHTASQVMAAIELQALACAALILSSRGDEDRWPSPAELKPSLARTSSSSAACASVSLPFAPPALWKPVPPARRQRRT
jgi:(p)ppGpp synthase/HD superfamily hydrolase